MMRTEMTNISMTESQPARSRASRSFVTYAPTTGTTLTTNGVCDVSLIEAC